MIDAAELAAAQGAYTFIAGALITLLVGGVAVCGLVIAGLAFTRIGQTFMPVMDEGTPVIIY